MASLHSPAGAIFFLQITISTLLAILFLQSGIDKIVDRSGNLAWLSGHFAKSPLAKFVPALLFVVTLLELAAGTLTAIGAVQLLLTRASVLAFYGACIAVATLLCLFFGQRMAKDYPGAAALVPYFLVAGSAVILLA